MKSEFAFIEQIRNRAAARRADGLMLGIGDDAAILGQREGRETLVTVDLLVEEVDFKLDYAVPRWLGHKTLAVSLSDIAAMGGAPKFSLLTLAIPEQSPISNLQSETFWEAFFEGYFALAEACGVALVGGDISSTPGGLAMDSMVIGHCAAGKAVRRSGARMGDDIYVTGALGASAAGLRLLLEGARASDAEASLAQSAIRTHLRPSPRVEFGRLAGESGLAHSMIDVSDGLAQDLPHICEESQVAAILEFDAVPIAEAVKLVTTDADAAFSLAVGGGEDFELLLTADRSNERALFDLASRCELPLARIGTITACEEAHPIRVSHGGDVKPLSIRGFDHFAAPFPD
ncbi:MAG: thiamine-phosphate kinase [Blastocatellia bacterium]